jgi:hypothetical protein
MDYEVNISEVHGSHHPNLLRHEISLGVQQLSPASEEAVLALYSPHLLDRACVSAPEHSMHGQQGNAHPNLSDEI